MLAARALVGTVWNSWHRDHAGSMGAALAYYTLFSLAPLLLIVISLAGLAFGDAAARGEMQSQLDTLMGPGSARAVQDLLASVRQPAQGVFATLLGVLLLVAGAVSVFGELQNALDRIWHVPEEATARSWPMLLRIRLLPYGMILALSFLLMVSLLLSAMLAALGHSLGRQLAEWEGVIRLGNIGSGFVLAALVFGLIFKVVPRVHVHWKDVWVGAAFTAALFELGKSLIGWYIGRTGAASGFGAAQRSHRPCQPCAAREMSRRSARFMMRMRRLSTSSTPSCFNADRFLLTVSVVMPRWLPMSARVIRKWNSFGE